MNSIKSFINYIKKKILQFFRISNSSIVCLYNGYGNNDKCIIFGHVLSYGPMARTRYRSNFISNTLALIRLFIIKPKKNAKVYFLWEGVEHCAKTENDGFFKFEWTPQIQLEPGWHSVEVEYRRANRESIKGFAKLSIPYKNQHTFISDIDDTFLISHSSNLRKRLFVLLTENARSRDPFEGVVNHYNLLANSFTKKGTVNPFFFVSSSEWNLYNYISEFSRINNLPEGVYLLNQLKQLRSILKTGQNNHSTKFMRIARIFEAYTEQLFVLLGDDTQADPDIYASIVKHFPKQVTAVYIRKVKSKSSQNT
ncbi:MAG: phosphatase domain-containing protein, partial [Ferruginibacter sp.]